jgi:hypothetical protein
MLAPSWYPSSRQLRQFALAALFGCALMGFWIWRSTGSVRTMAIASAVGVVVFLTGLMAPAAVRPLYVVLMAVTLPVGWLVSRMLLLAIYFVLITPIGRVFRLFGRDHLALKRPQVGSYWRPYRPPKDVGSYFRQA